MIEVTRLELDIENKKLYLSCNTHSTNKLAFIRIDTQNTFICQNDASDASTKYEFEVPATSCINKEFDLEYFLADLNKDLLIVYIYSEEGSIMEGSYLLYDNKSLTLNIYNILKSNFNICNCCNGGATTEMIDAVLLYNGITLAVQQEDFKECVKLWKLLLNTHNTTNSCHCNK